jgi:GDP-4-dehydro-6-deoxy-D-mannose reductase
MEQSKKEEDLALDIINPSFNRDIIDIRDAAAAILAVVLKGKVGEIYNIGTGKAITNKAVLVSLASAVTLNGKLKAKLMNKENEEKCLIADISRLSSSIGFTPSFKIEDSLKELINTVRVQSQSSLTTGSKTEAKEGN